MRTLVLMAAVMITAAAYGQDAVTVEPTDGGAMVGVDLLAGTNAEGEREQGWAAAVWESAKDNKFKVIAGAVAAAVAVELIAEKNDYLWHKDDAPKSAKKPVADKDPTAAPETKPQPGGTTQTTDEGGSNTDIDININTGDNSPVTITLGGQK